MTVLTFKETMERHLRCRLECVVTQNRSTMLRVLEKGIGWIRLSVHEMFLAAPEEIIVAIVAYVKQSRKGRELHQRRLKEYIHANYSSYQGRLPKLQSKGHVYDLDQLMTGVNKEYFEGKLELSITWFKGRQGNRRILFGSYEENLRLVKISDRLDDIFIPDYFIRYVIYHEMLHSIVASYVDEKGCCRMHGPEFKKREKCFSEYRQAREWEKINKERFFGRA